MPWLRKSNAVTPEEQCSVFGQAIRGKTSSSQPAPQREPGQGTGGRLSCAAHEGPQDMKD